MGAYADDSGCDGEPILESSYKSVPIPTLITKNVVELLLEKAKENTELGRDNWMTDTTTGYTLTFADVDPMSRRAASAMVKRGMTKGDVALYLTMDVTKIYTTILGIWRVGGVMYSSYPEDTSDTHRTRILQSKARWVFCDPPSIPQVREAIKDLPWFVEIIVFGEEDGCTTISEIYEDDGADCPEKVTTELNDPLLILCTSGTTGKSKGAVYTNKCLLAFCLGTIGIPYLPLPAFLMLRCTHVLGCLFPIRNIFVGVWCVMMSQLTKENIFRTVEDYQPILAFGFPTFLQMLASPEAQSYDRSSLLIIVTGGMVLTSQFSETMLTLPEVKYCMNGYGMTECGALATTIDLSGTNGYRSIPNLPDLSVGKLYPNTSLKVLDLESGRALGPNQKGEIVIKSPIMSSGYWEQKEETEEAFVDGWLKTGDLGYYDENGFIFVLDRIKETFKYFNNHISPAELEEIILTHPAVNEVSCFGIRDPHGGDHVPRAVCVLKSKVNATAEEIMEFVDSKVAPYKKIRGGLYIVPELPRGKTGKVMRSMVANMTLIPV